jgi:hypothetical protein
LSRYHRNGKRLLRPGINEHLAVSACQDTNIPTRTLQDTDVTAEPVNFDGRFRGFVTDHIHDRACAKACRGASHPPLAADAVAVTQHKQNPRRDMMC